MRSYVIYCEICNYKKLIENPNEVELVSHKTVEVQGRLPTLDKETNKTKIFDFVSAMPKFKCPNCGRVVTLKKNNVPKINPKDENKTE